MNHIILKTEKERQRIYGRIDRDIYAKFRHYCFVNKIDIQDVVEEIVLEFMKNKNLI